MTAMIGTVIGVLDACIRYRLGTLLGASMLRSAVAPALAGINKTTLPRLVVTAIIPTPWPRRGHGGSR
ncbi:MAG TPA: hypothetical protein VJU15_03665 [Gemmatimonadales bacterium]|nr:hypothetical protein [Gemmatimonadales bacterium]